MPVEFHSFLFSLKKTFLSAKEEGNFSSHFFFFFFLFETIMQSDYFSGFNVETWCSFVFPHFCGLVSTHSILFSPTSPDRKRIFLLKFTIFISKILPSRPLRSEREKKKVYFSFSYYHNFVSLFLSFWHEANAYISPCIPINMFTMFAFQHKYLFFF